jgi:hypothetical protein
VAERNSLRVSNLLGVGKCLFGGSHGSTEDARWYGLTERKTGLSGTAYPQCCPRKAFTFPQSGIGIASVADAEVVFFAIPNGINGKGSHTHNDKLSFVLRLGGEEVLCDSGTGTYTRDPILRNQFRSSAAHNVVVVDGKEQNTIDESRTGLFWIGSEADVSGIEQWRERDELLLRASHSGYQRVGVTHTRTIRLAKHVATVDDHLEGCGLHRFEIYFQLAAGWKICSLENLRSEIRVQLSGTRQLGIALSGVQNWHARQEDQFVSMCYGSLTPSVRLRFWGDGNLPTRLTTTINWHQANGIIEATEGTKGGGGR